MATYQIITQKIDKVSSNGYSKAPPIQPKRLFYREYDPLSFKSSHLGCSICKSTFKSNVQVRKHLHSHIFFQNRCLTLEESHDFIFEISFSCNQISAEFVVRNIGPRVVTLGHVYIVNKNNATLKSFDESFLHTDETTVFSLERDLIGFTFPNTIIIQTLSGTSEYFEYHELVACCGKPGELDKTMDLVALSACQELRSILKQEDVEIDSYFRSFRAQYPKLDYTNYATILSKLSMIERATNQCELDHYDLINVKIKMFSDNDTDNDNDTDTNLFEVFVENVKDKMNQLTTFDLVEITSPNSKNWLIRGSIYKLLKHHIVFEPNEKNTEPIEFDKNRLYNMTFHINGYTYDMEDAALHYAYDNGIVKHLFPTSVTSVLPSSIYERKFDWINTNIVENELQMQAVRHIVESTSHPVPYILFGPPGTGKTKTLVEAISQIYIQDRTSRILVCATSNAAADELAERLIQNLPNYCWIEHHVYRIYSTSYDPDIPIKQNLRHSSNYDLKYIPDLEFLGKFRIIVSTLLIGGSLRFADPPGNYFTHLFIDECGSSTEISTLLPIACAPHAKIVLSGDPKQLGPVVTSKHASKLGLGLSLLERLIDTSEVYQKDPITNIYNANAITKLAYNYRSHAAIISPSNRLFYDGDLVSKGDKSYTHCFVNWPHLPSSETPIIFHPSFKKSQREHNSTSIFNMDEVNVLLKYIKLLMKETINGKPVQETDIGIISPYKKQCQKIKDQLEQIELYNIMVATVELFQGKEKPIILVSTTRCQMGGIGFLNSPQRLNVLLTRAQCLLIIVGDPYTLKRDKNWRQVLSEFKDAGAWTLHTSISNKHVAHTNSKVTPNWNRSSNWRNDTKTDQMIREFGDLKVNREKSTKALNWRQ